MILGWVDCDVFVLMSEMEETADHVIVIGKGRLIADASIASFTQGGSTTHIRVLSPQAEQLAGLLREAGATHSLAADGALLVANIEAAQIGDIAASHGLRLHELSPQRASLEAAFMEMTDDSVEYRQRSAEPELAGVGGAASGASNWGGN
jgi:ABC-2 type transport system ATP-binding protein